MDTQENRICCTFGKRVEDRSVPPVSVPARREIGSIRAGFVIVRIDINNIQ